MSVRYTTDLRIMLYIQTKFPDLNKRDTLVERKIDASEPITH